MLLQAPGVGKTYRGIGTTFEPVEVGLNNGIWGCTGERWDDPSLPICASRTLPCGSWLRVENVKTGLFYWCKVMDRGPYGKIGADGNWFNAAKDRKDALKEGRPPKEGKYRSILDMSPSVSSAIGSNGMARVKIRRVGDEFLSFILDGSFLIR